ncbi:MAG TPA: maleylacetoacetate isomerase [Casimicrobiaceae bacterium]|nr:maleylacetoacetate isomerase [Casimicrobiaceae bacterium]
MKLYGYFRSSAAYRVRIALGIKGLPYEYAAVHLRKGEQSAEPYRALNPAELVPALVDDRGAFTQSLAIIEYLDERYPEPPLLPRTIEERARVRAIALSIACDIHPLDNLRVLRYLVGTLGASEATKDAWYRHWIDAGLTALEAQLSRDPATGEFCHGAAPTLADCCLVPQLANARRASIPLDSYPTLVRIEARCNALPAFAGAVPERQPDAE